VLDELMSGTAVEEDADERDTDSRVNAVRALASVCVTLFSPPQRDGQDKEGAGIEIVSVEVSLPAMLSVLQSKASACLRLGWLNSTAR
jgi:hypothetical protein